MTRVNAASAATDLHAHESVAVPSAVLDMMIRSLDAIAADLKAVRSAHLLGLGDAAADSIEERHGCRSDRLSRASGGRMLLGKMFLVPIEPGTNPEASAAARIAERDRTSKQITVTLGAGAEKLSFTGEPREVERFMKMIGFEKPASSK